jgi:tetratricopeptide (TPR) repeat protein
MLGEVIYHDFTQNISHAAEPLFETEIVDIKDVRKRVERKLTSQLEKELDDFFDKRRRQLTSISERIYSLNPWNPVALCSKALQKYQVGVFDVAVDYLYTALENDSKNRHAMCAMLAFFGNSPTERYFSRTEIFDFAMKVDAAHPDDPYVLEKLLSLSIYQLEDVTLADMYYQRGANLYPARFKEFEGPMNRFKERRDA